MPLAVVNVPLVQVDVPPCHEAKSSPERWDAAFEKTLRITTAKGHFIPTTLEDRMSPRKHQEKLDQYPNHVRNLCCLQLEVSILALNAWDSDDLATKWLDASVDVRKKHVLIGIAGACGSSPNLNHARLSCAKELRVSYLSSDGHILLDMISALAPHDLTKEPAHPQYINNDEWNELLTVYQNSQDKIEMLALRYILVLRTKLITHVIHFIICSFLGYKLPEINVHKKPHSHNKVTPTPTPMEQFCERAMFIKYGERKAEEIKAELKAAYKERTAGKVISCRNCTLNATTRETFKRCGSCWKIDREVLYCSKECQRANWKQHKLMCGKTLDYDTSIKLAAVTKTADDASDFVPPANGFKPTLELRLQMRYLKSHPTFEYLVLRSVYTNGEKYAMLSFPNPAIGPVFRLHRDKAMKTGNQLSAALMCDCVLWYIEVLNSSDIRREKVLDQFSREYRIPLVELEVDLEEMGKIRAKYQNQYPTLSLLPKPTDV